MDKKPILYIIMRNDLPSMNIGKAMAQASHASAQFVAKYKNTTVLPNETETAFRAWINEGNNFGTTIVLEGSYSSISNFTIDTLDNRSILHQGGIVDGTYPFKAQKELLDIMDLKENNKKNIQIIDDIIDKFGMVSCTRIETTCYWMFFYGTDEEHELFKELCKKHNIELHR